MSGSWRRNLPNQHNIYRFRNRKTFEYQLYKTFNLVNYMYNYRPCIIGFISSLYNTQIIISSLLTSQFYLFFNHSHNNRFITCRESVKVSRQNVFIAEKTKRFKTCNNPRRKHFRGDCIFLPLVVYSKENNRSTQ